MDKKPFYTTKTFFILSSILYAAVLAAVFMFAIWTLTSDINTAFTREQKNLELYTIDQGRYELLKKKLGLPEIAPRASETGTTTQTTYSTSTIASTSTVVATQGYNKASTTIKILNATGISGLAGKYADELKASGFTAVTTGNASANEESSILEFRDALTSQNIDDILRSLPAKLKSARQATTTLKSTDLIITIGKDLAK